MKRKFSVLAILTGLVIVAAVPRYANLVTSARTFNHYFQAMETSTGSLGTVERVAYSLILATSQAPLKK
jgi:hypothetical protein